MTMTTLTKLQVVAIEQIESIVEIKEVKKASLVPMESAVVYNKFDIHSLMAAAVYSGRVSPTTGVKYELLDTTVLLHSDFNEYIWVGVTPETGIKGFIHKTIKKEAKHIKVEIDHYDPELERKITVYEEAVKQVGADTTSSFALGNALEHFFDHKLTMQELVFIHKNYIKARDCIESGSIFEPIPYSNNLKADDKVSFFAFINKVKSKLKNSYKASVGVVNNKKFKYCLLALNIDDYSWALRIVQMSHQYYLNVVNCLRGYVIDTNIPNLTQMKLVDEYGYLNSY